MNLTPKQLRILQLIRDSRIRRGYSPTMQELADEIGVSKVTVFEHVEALIKKGALIREPNKARSLSIAEGIAVPDESRPLRYPMVGKIAADQVDAARAGLAAGWIQPPATDLTVPVVEELFAAVTATD